MFCPRRMPENKPQLSRLDTNPPGNSSELLTDGISSDLQSDGGDKVVVVCPLIEEPKLLPGQVGYRARVKFGDKMPETIFEGTKFWRLRRRHVV